VKNLKLFELPINKIPGDYYWDYFLKEPELEIMDLISDYSISIDRKKYLFKKYVCIINIETSTYCNRMCTYCPNSIYDRSKQKYISSQSWNRLLSDLIDIKYCSTISLNQYNEPLADKYLFDKISQLKNELPNSFIKFNSNGDFINSEILDRLVESGNNAIFITLHTNNWEIYKDDLKKKQFETFYKKIGKDLNFETIIPNTMIQSEFYHKGMRVLVMANNWSKYGNNRSGIISELSIQNRINPCVRPFRELTVAHDGFVYPCCQFFPDIKGNNKFRVGNVENDGLFNIYLSSELNSIRKNLLPFGLKMSPCNTCRDNDKSTLESTFMRNNLIKMSDKDE